MKRGASLITHSIDPRMNVQEGLELGGNIHEMIFSFY